MPSALHEALVMLFRECPRLGPTLLAPVLDIEVPEDERVGITSAEFAEMHPPEYRADAVVRVEQADSEPLSRWTRRVITAATLAEIFDPDEP